MGSEGAWPWGQQPVHSGTLRHFREHNSALPEANQYRYPRNSTGGIPCAMGVPWKDFTW